MGKRVVTPSCFVEPCGILVVSWNLGDEPEDLRFHDGHRKAGWVI